MGRGTGGDGADIPDRERAWARARRQRGRGVFTEQCVGFPQSGREKGAKKPTSNLIFMILKAVAKGSVRQWVALARF